MQKLADLTVVIIAHNEAVNLRQLLPLVQNFAGKILLLDNNSSDETKKIASEFKADYFFCQETSFAALRNHALTKVKTAWLFYLDADERVTPRLAAEINHAIQNSAINALALKRENYCYGEKLAHGGWDRDLVTRIFRLASLESWQGEIHESPVFTGHSQTLTTALLHLTHQNTAANLRKSASWTIKEAQLFSQSAQPVKITKGTIWRKTLMEFYRRYYRDQGYKDGMVGFIESFVQAVNRAFVYIQIWELQQQPSLVEKYQQLEKQVAEMWETETKRTINKKLRN